MRNFHKIIDEKTFNERRMEAKKQKLRQMEEEG